VADNISDRAFGSWAAESEKDMRPPAYIPMLACGGAFSNLNDMSRYVQFHLGDMVNSTIVPNPGIMQKVTFPVKGQKGGYTPGLERYPLGNSFYLFQEGGGYGFESAIIIYPEFNLGFVILTNSCWTKLNGSTMADLINGVIGPLNRTGDDDHPEKYTGEYKKLDNCDTVIGKILGIYDNDKKIYKINDTIFFEDRGSIYPLDFYSDNGTLVADYGDYREIRFLPELRGRPGNIQIVNFRTGMTRYAFYNKPLPENDRQGPGKAGWKTLTGTYNLYIDSLYRGRFRVTLDNGYITVNGCRCHEFRPGMFVNCEGSVFDFTGSEPTIAGFSLAKQKE
jgi:hypothetical protein